MSKKAIPIAGWGTSAKQKSKICAEVFQGETMTCVICGDVKQSDPSAQSDWRAVDIDGRRFYACKKEFPPDGLGTVKAFEAAYNKFLTAAVIKMRGN